MKTLYGLGVKAAEVLFAMVMLPLLVGACIFTRFRRNHGELPRVALGPTPVISLKYISQALRLAGYKADTCVFKVYKINDRSDFDLHEEDLVSLRWLPRAWRKPVRRLIGPYGVFLSIIFNYDCLIMLFEGGYLSKTPWVKGDLPLLRLAGCRTIIFPYGGDCAVPSLIHSMAWRHGLSASYPMYGLNEASTIRRLARLCRQADFVLACIVHWETLPTWDLIATLCYPIDTELWRMPEPELKHETVVIMHSPNHRGMKGTEHLIAASEKLNDEGVKHELRLLENMTNLEVRAALMKADILVEQLLLGYALSAVEGMALGKVVVSNLTDDHYYAFHRASTGLDECPIVSATTETIEGVLRDLIMNESKRRAIAKKGRDYVMKFHSYGTMGRMWDQILRHIWMGQPRPASAWHPDKS